MNTITVSKITYHSIYIFIILEPVALSVVHLSPLGSQLSFSNAATKLENVADWEAIAKKYRALMGEQEETKAEGDAAVGSVNASQATLPVANV